MPLGPDERAPFDSVRHGRGYGVALICPDHRPSQSHPIELGFPHRLPDLPVGPRLSYPRFDRGSIREVEEWPVAAGSPLGIAVWEEAVVQSFRVLEVHL